MWSADPFTSTPEHPPEPAGEPAAKGEFAFAGLLDEAARSPRDKTIGEPRPPLAQDHPDKLLPGDPSAELLEATRDDTMRDMPPVPAEPEVDPDEEHWRETFEKFRELKAQLGEPADRISFEKFSAKLRKNRDDLLAKHSAKGVRFVVYEKAGRAAIKASAIR
jgi:hypothetical protein